MRKSTTTVAVAAPVVVALAITFTLISRSNDNRMNDDHMSDNSTSEFNNADVMFAQMMIPHHEQTIEMSDMVLAKSGVDPEVTALAQQIKAAQQPEIDMMKAWLNAWGHPAMGDRGMQHDSHGGMMTDDEMQQLERANGTDGQPLFLEGMIRHHEGAIRMAQTEIDCRQEPGDYLSGREHRHQPAGRNRHHERATQQGLTTPGRRRWSPGPVRDRHLDATGDARDHGRRPF